MSSLRRTMAAGFTLDQAVTLEDVRERGAALLLPTDRFFAGCPAHRLTSQRRERLCRNGNPIPGEGLEEGALYRVYGQDGTFLCLSRCQRGMLVSVKNFFGG